MNALRFLVVFLAVSCIVTVGAITATFIFWSFLPVQPGTATALAMLFLVAPGTGVVAGFTIAIRSVRQRSRGDAAGSGRSSAASKWLRAGLAALVGGLAGYGACLAAIDLTYTDRWANPNSAPPWLPAAPSLAGLAVALLLGLVVLLSNGRSRSN